MKVWCFFNRADLDGHCSAAIVRRWCGLNGHEFIPRGVDYGESADWMEGAGPDSMALIADFTPEGDGAGLMLEAMGDAYGRGLVWVDHHKTALERRIGDIGILGLRKVGAAACELTWRTLFPAADMPPAVRLLGRYDVFDRSDPKEWEKAILPFQYGLRMRETLPDSHAEEKKLWKTLLCPDKDWFIPQLIHEGMLLLRSERKGNEIAALAGAYDCVFEGLPCCAMNGSGNSLRLDAYARPEHRMRIMWAFTGGRWKVSLFENGDPAVDCGAVAARHGGGGHRGAAGFFLPADLSPLVFFAPESGENAERRTPNAKRPTGNPEGGGE